MNTTEYFRSLSEEITALKNRVRNFIDDAHWQTDGEWKESVLRAMLNRHLPYDVEAVRGFVLTSTGCSQQIDVLLYDKSKPVLFRDGDLVFITPDAVKGIVEVKSNVKSKPELLEFLNKLAKDAELILDGRSGSNSQMFVGLFSYDVKLTQTASEATLSSLQESASGIKERVTNHVVLGPSLFARFWDYEPNGPDTEHYDTWHSYSMNHLAYGYFINNLLYSISASSVTENQFLYFPREGKEMKKTGTIPLQAV